MAPSTTNETDNQPAPQNSAPATPAVYRTAAQEKAKGASNREFLFEVTQAVLAIIVVMGGGAILFMAPENPNATFVGGAIGTVLALYFQKKVNGYPKE